MAERKHELLLVALALVLFAGILVYSVLDQAPLQAQALPQAGASVQETATVVVSAADSQAAQETQSDVDTTAQTKAAQPSIVNINTADVKQLTTLPGIGEVKAQAIIAYRNENGAYRSVDELLSVKGIGQATLEKLRAYVVI